MDDDTRAVLVTYVATLAAFKIVTSILILYFFPSWHAVIVIVAVSAPWFVVGFWYGGIYSRIRLRLVRGRLRRHAMMRQEWHID